MRVRGRLTKNAGDSREMRETWHVCNSESAICKSASLDKEIRKRDLYVIEHLDLWTLL